MYHNLKCIEILNTQLYFNSKIISSDDHCNYKHHCFEQYKRRTKNSLHVTCHTLSETIKKEHHVTTNLLLTMLHKICTKAKLNDRHLIGF
jgi:hypothetical protein